MVGRIGCVAFVGLVIVLAGQRGARWDFGRRGLPEPIVGADGRYPDGTLVDPINRALVESGRHHEVLCALAALIGSWLVWLVYSIWSDERQRRRLLALDERTGAPRANRRNRSET